MKHSSLKPLAGWMLALLLAACGGDKVEDSNSNRQGGVYASSIISNTDTDTGSPSDTPGATRVRAGGTLATTAAPVTPAAAAQFLSQATFGPSNATINALVASNKADWINAQFKIPQSSHRYYMNRIAATGETITPQHFYESFWKQAVSADDQLRQRVAFALSQIFVVSLADSNVVTHPIGVAAYYDMLGQNAFGNFRNLLQGVASHPMMGIYLSHMHNEKEDGIRLPDENFAREVMQLMTIGLYQLNQDGSVKLSNGKPIETYTHADVMGLAKVFTGWSWAGPDRTFERFHGASVVWSDREWTPMQMYPTYHSTTAKSFLGVTTNGSGEADMKVALDTLFNHPNVGPFIGRQLIQHLVSSNPSPAYVGRVAAAFADNGAGVRGDMQAVVRAVLLDPEAADTGAAKKLREPILRLANWMRAFRATSASGRYRVGTTDDPLDGLGQTPMRAPSVFNYFRPQYIPPNTSLSSAGMVAPEMQITSEPTVTGYLNYMQTAVGYGVGLNNDVQASYVYEKTLADSPKQLIDHVELLLINGSMSSTLRNQITTALNGVGVPIDATPAQKDSMRMSRVCLAIFLTMASAEYLAQR